MDNLNNQIKSVSELLSLPHLAIPNYQRPYRWGIKNLADLFNDIATHQEKTAYRLGSIVFHYEKNSDEKEKASLDIVDGQQRTLTLMLIIQALIEEKLDKLEKYTLKQQLQKLAEPIESFMNRQYFSSKDSEHNLRRNYLDIRRRVARPDFTENQIDFLLNRCQVVCFVLHDISEAFQFFDSQNARGRDLAPHDLLKAFHLREFPLQESHLKANVVAHWEKLPDNKLSELFAYYLYRVRQWANGKSARFFGKDDIHLFKGINIEQIDRFPYVESLRLAHHFVDDYNAQYQRKIDSNRIDFPFSLNQMIINGRRFFEMAEHYQKQVAAIVAEESKPKESEIASDKKIEIRLLGELLTQIASRILITLNSYTRKHRTGDKYIRNMFDCALIFYIDKFGSHELSMAIERCFIWAYQCRIQYKAVQLATMDNYVLGRNFIRVIQDARTPYDLHHFPLKVLTEEDNKNTGKKDELIKLFKEMKYYE